MSGREDERDDTGVGGAYDDWFDEPEPPPERRRRGQRRAAVEGDEDAWMLPDEHARRPARRGPHEPLVIAGREVTQLQAFLVGGSALVVLLAILAAAGVFSSGSKPVAQPTTITTPKAPTTTQTQTAQTTPTSPTANVTPPSTPLKPGDSGSQVTLLQKALAALGFSPGKADGTYGAGTTSAVKDFQNSKELTADGIAGSATIAALRQALAGGSGGGQTASAQAPSTTLKPGDSGSQVTLLQQALAALGYSPGKADGTYGPGTKQAVSSFQQAQGLAADGVLGPKTLAALRQALSTTG